MIRNGKIKVEKVDIPIEELPDKFEGLRIVHISDIHIKRFGKREKKIVKIINELNPSVLFITGDIVSRDVLKEVEKFWWGIKTKYGIWAVQGNWEHKYSMTGERVKEVYKKYGVKLLINESDKLYIKDNYIGIIGIDDPFTFHDNMSKALGGLPEDSVKILLSHSPSIIDEASENGISLVLTGHTHGGQIAIPGIGAIVKRRDCNGYVSGKYTRNQTQIYVNRGIGTSILPIRLFCPPEITLIKLKRDSSQSDPCWRHER
ncbi:MAG TPA: metallophosphoesterase [Nitrospinota bacterium]|nr:metallophosphoesterase [Nitrospinota bacterium]